MESMRVPLIDSASLEKRSSGACGWFTGRVRGYTLALLAVLAVSPDACLLRYIRWNSPTGLTGDQTWSGIAVILCIKYAMMGCIQMIFVFLTSGVDGSMLVGSAAKSWRALAAPSFFMLVTQIGFTIGLLETTAANAITYFSLNPLWAALMGRAFLNDRVRRHTIIAMAVAFCAIGMAFVPAIIMSQDGDGDGETESDAPPEGASSPTLHGDITALATGVSLAAFITSSRAGSLHDAEAPMGLAPALGSLGASALVAPMAYYACNGAVQAVLHPAFLCFLLTDAVLEAFYDLWMGQAAEDITSAEVALVLLLEIPLGPLYVYFAFHEVPPIYTIIGSAVLMLALVGHGVVDALYASNGLSRSSSHTLSSADGSPIALAFDGPTDDLTASPTSGLAVRRTHSWNDGMMGSSGVVAWPQRVHHLSPAQPVLPVGNA